MFDLLQESHFVRERELQRVALHEKKKQVGGYPLIKKIQDLYILLDEKERAMELMLETPNDHAAFYIDTLKACLLAAALSLDTSVTTSTHFKTTVRLAASNLIAHGHLDEGVQLLCLLGPQARLDAARYLQSYDRWTDAAWLLKVCPHLTIADMQPVLTRWAQHLLNNTSNMQQHAMAYELLLSLKCWTEVLSALATHSRIDIAALLAYACELRELLPMDNALVSLVQNVYLDYGLVLQRLGLLPLARHYWALAGPAGSQLLTSVSTI